MERIKMYAIKADLDEFKFINYAAPNNALSQHDFLIKPMLQNLYSVLHKYLNETSENYVITVYLNNDFEMDIDRLVNKKLSKEDQKTISGIIEYISQIYINVLSDME